MIKSTRIIITNPIHEKAILALKSAGFSVDKKFNITQNELLKIIGNYHILVGRTTTKITKEILEAAKKLICIGVHATGWDHIDIETANKLGITLLGFPSDHKKIFSQRTEGAFVATAEHTILLMLAAAGNFYNVASSMKSGKWEKYSFDGIEIYGKTLGIIGLGRIGSLVADRALALGMKVLVYHPRLNASQIKKFGAKKVSLEVLCKQSDVITIHVPKTKETLGLLGEKEFKNMKKGSILINTARAAIVDQKSLKQSLKQKHLRCAAIDVYDNPPYGIDWNLVNLPNVIATPHIAGVSQESIERISLYVATQIINFIKYNKQENAINNPKNPRKI